MARMRPTVASLGRLLPDDRIARALTLQSTLWAFGTGTFITGNAVYFTRIVGLTPAQVGLGLTIAGVVTFATALPLGRLADIVGRKRQWIVSTVAVAALHLFYPLAHGFAEFVLLIMAIEVVGSAGGSAFNAYTLEVFDPAERVRWMAYLRAALNVGFTLGALAGGLALASPTDGAVRALPLATAAIYLVCAVSIHRLPNPSAAAEAAETERESKAVPTASVLRNRGFVATAFLDGVMTTNQVLLNVVIPLWLVAKTDAPRWLLAWLFGTNTVMAVLLQVRAARGVTSIEPALRATRRSAACFVLSCAILVVTHDTIGWVTVALMWVGHITVTGAELYESAAMWAFESELTDPARRGEYSGAARLGHTLGSVWAPAVYTFLAMSWAPWGWLVIAGIVLAAVAALPYAVRSAQAYLRGSVAASQPLA